MATNGDADRLANERLAQVERAIIGARNGPAPAELANTTADNVGARVEAAAELCREAGRYAKDHGTYLDEISRAFAEKLQAMTADYVINLLEAERRKMAELEKIVGKIVR